MILDDESEEMRERLQIERTEAKTNQNKCAKCILTDVLKQAAHSKTTTISIHVRRLDSLGSRANELALTDRRMTTSSIWSADFWLTKTYAP